VPRSPLFVHCLRKSSKDRGTGQKVDDGSHCSSVLVGPTTDALYLIAVVSVPSVCEGTDWVLTGSSSNPAKVARFV
jgi:hypothetical protein